jgi:DNA-directed RNA polymerase specialized sigma24 family protein
LNLQLILILGNEAGNLQGKRQCSLSAMTLVPTDLHATNSTNVTAIFAGLQRDWERITGRPEMKARFQEWALAEPVLERCSGANGIVRSVRWQGRRPTDEGASVMAALERQAADPLAARTLLQALLPRIRAEKVLVPKYGHGIDEAWQRPADTVADLVAECFVAVKRHAGEDRDDVARLVLQEATRRLRSARQVQRRYHLRTALLLPDDPGSATADLSEARSPAEWLAVTLTDAVRSNHLSKGEARLVYGARVKGLPVSEVGRRVGMPPKAVYYALARAERSLVWRAA